MIADIRHTKVRLLRECTIKTDDGMTMLKKFVSWTTGTWSDVQEDQLRALYIHSKEAKVKLDDTIGYCHVPECRLRALAPSDFCRTRTTLLPPIRHAHAHARHDTHALIFLSTDILRDPQQQLYIGCTYAKGEWHAARGHTCGQPILRTTQPPLCDAHMDASAEQQELAAALASHKKKKKSSSSSSSKKRKASQLLEERDKARSERGQRESKTSARKKSAGKGKRRETNSNIDTTTNKTTAATTADWMGITSQNASQFPLALVLAKVDYNVGIIQEKRGLLLDEENKRRQQQQQQQEEDSDDVEEEATAAS